MNVAEILISAKENLAGLQRVKNELKALGVTAQDTAKRTELANRLMTMGVEPARAINMVAKSWVEVENKVQSTTRSLQQGQQAASGLSQLLGVQLPQAATRFLASSQTIGPVLAGAFSAVGVLALIQTLGQLPAAFEKISASITGWSEDAKKAYDEVIGKNRELVQAMQASERLTATLGGGDAGGVRFDIARQEEIRSRALAAIRDLQSRPRAPEVFNEFGQAQPLEDKSAELGRLQKAADDATQEIKKLEIALGDLEKKSAPAIAAAGAKLANFLRGAESALTAPPGRANFSGLLGGAGATSIGGILSPAGPVMSQAEMLGFAMEELDRTRQAGAEKDAIMFAARQKDAEVLVRLSEQFIQNFRDGAGRVWDDFFIKGQNVLTNLGNLMKGLLNTIGRTLFQNFATGLLTGAKSGGGGGIGGAVGGLGAGIGAKVGLGALFGGGSSAVAGSLAPGAIGILGANGGLVTGSSAGAAGGIGGALGLGGGAGLLGLGAATIPVVGGIVAAGIFAFMKLRHRTEEAPFTSDPFRAERNRTILFFTRMEEALDRFTNTFGVARPGDVVMAGMPGALASNSFRRSTASVLVDDI